MHGQNALHAHEKGIVMAMLDYATARITPTPAHRETPHLEQGELFARLKLQPLPLFKHGPEDEAHETRH